jgi:hypothetical protein
MIQPSGSKFGLTVQLIQRKGESQEIRGAWLDARTSELTGTDRSAQIPYSPPQFCPSVSDSYHDQVSLRISVQVFSCFSAFLWSVHKTVLAHVPTVQSLHLQFSEWTENPAKEATLCLSLPNVCLFVERFFLGSYSEGFLTLCM